MTREEAINTLGNFKRYISGGGVTDLKANEAIDMAIEALQAKAVQGEWARKEKEINDCDGHRVFSWYECDQCGSRPPINKFTKQDWNFCPNCGAKMTKGGDDNE